MADKKYVVAVTGASGENGQAFEEGQIVTQADFGKTWERLQKLSTFREATEEDEKKWRRTQSERGELPPAAASEVTTGNETPTGVGAKGEGGATDQGEDLEKLTVPELRTRAEALEISPMPTLKAELINAIKEAEAKKAQQ